MALVKKHIQIREDYNKRHIIKHYANNDFKKRSSNSNH